MAVRNPGALLRRLLQERSEMTWLEFKHNNGDPDMIGRCISACANGAMLSERNRAFIVWGVQNGTKERLGTTVVLADIKRGGVNLANWLSQKLEPRLQLEFYDFEDNGKQFSVLEIEPTYSRPVRFDGEEYIRIGENVKKLRDFPNHEQSLWIATSRHKFEEAVALMHQTEAEIFEKLDVGVFYRLSEIPEPQSDSEILKQFCSKGFIREDMEGGYDVTNLGAILFAKNVKEFPSISNKSVRVVKYTGVDKSQSEGEIEGQRGYAAGFEGLRKYIVGQLPKSEKYDNGIRKVVSHYSEIAMREFVANALIHQDLTISGACPMIEIYQDRVEVTNPGNSLINIDRIIDERRSRNEKLADAMRMLNICEARGGGIDKAIIDTEKLFLPAPQFFESGNAMRVVIFGPRPFSQLSKADKNWACFCHCVIRWTSHDYMSNTSLRERFHLPDTEYQAVSTIISDTKKSGKITLADKTQTTRYARYVPYWAAVENE